MRHDDLHLSQDMGRWRAEACQVGLERHHGGFVDRHRCHVRLRGYENIDMREDDIVMVAMETSISPMQTIMGAMTSVLRWLKEAMGRLHDILATLSITIAAMTVAMRAIKDSMGNMKSSGPDPKTITTAMHSAMAATEHFAQPIKGASADR